ncbi:hypothetical protein WJX84_001522 [Apatococcus fuscideae]|uniref:Uncharacterized protein n=1 Tax=Apatococcus fuscideae TaxID=2026836 RepID=A0AAW1SVB8_9CHLO
MSDEECIKPIVEENCKPDCRATLARPAGQSLALAQIASGFMDSTQIGKDQSWLPRTIQRMEGQGEYQSVRSCR